MQGRLGESREQYALALVEKPGSAVATNGLRVAASALEKSRVAPSGPPRAVASAAAPAADASVSRASLSPDW